MPKLKKPRAPAPHSYSSRPSSSAFTIVELLIVVVIIAILAAITIVAYNGMQNRARASQASAALVDAKKKLELHKVINSSYPTTGNLSTAGVADGAATFQYTSDSTAYCVTATVSNVSYYLNSTTAASPTQGGCPGHGQGGAGAVTNLIANPSMETDNSGGLYRWFGNSPGAGTNEWVAGIGLNGGYGIRKTWTVSPGASADAGFQWSFMAPTVGQPYTCSAYATASVTQQMHARIEYYDSVGSRFANSNGVATSVPANTLTRMSATGTVPVNTVRLQCVVEVLIGGSYVNFAPGDRMWADAAMLTASAALTGYADGSSPNWVWNGTPHASTSTGPAL